MKNKTKELAGVAFLGAARYPQPLDSTSAKKFRELTALRDIFVIGFSQDLKGRRFTEFAHFYLLPRCSLPLLRYMTFFLVGPWLTLWLIWRHGVWLLVAQSPYEAAVAAYAKVIAQWFGRRVALVVESHGDFEESVFLQRRTLTPSLYRLLMRVTARFALTRADVLRAVSNSTREQLERWVPGKTVVQFVTWTNIEVFLHAGAEEWEARTEIVYAGVLIQRKGVHHLINAFAAIAPDCPEAKLVVIGPDENKEYAASLRTQVTQLGLDMRVVFAGELLQSELAHRMAQARLFVLPTYSEGLPRVVFEAMAVGLPVIASAVSGIPEVVEDGVTGFLVPPGDEAALAERLRWVVKHPMEAQGIGERARAFAQCFFSSAVYVDGYRRMFKLADITFNSRQP